MTARERLKQQVDKDRIERGSPALSARERLRQKVEQDRTAISTRAAKAEQGVSPSAPAVVTDNTALINEGKRLQGNVERAKTELYQSGGQREYEERLRAAETAYQNWWNANPNLHETVGRKATAGEEVDYQAGRFLKGLGSAVQGTIGFVDKLVGDDLAILGSLVDATTGGKTQLEKPIQQWADNALKTDILGADKFGQNVENSMAGIKPSKARDFVGGISESAGAMLPAIATSGIAGAAGLGAGTTQTLNYLTFGSGAAGNAAKQALAEGADMSEAVEYGMMSGMLEVLSESMFAGIAGMNPSGVLDDVMKKLTQNGTIQFLGNTLGEGVEEAVVEFLTPYIQRATYDPDAANTTFAELAKSFASGAAMSFLMTGANAVASGDPASVLRGTRGTAEQEVLQDKYGRVEEQQVSDVFRNGALMPDIAENRPVENANVPTEETPEEVANKPQETDIEAARAKLSESVMNSAKKVLGEEGYKAFEEVTRDVDNPADYFGELTKAYNAGLTNKRGDSDVLSATQYSAMFEAGRTDAVVSTEKQAKAKGFATVYGKESGLVYDAYVVNNVNEKTAKVINSTAKLLGIRVRFVDSVAGGSANAQIENGDMLIEKGNPNPLRALFAHEITHRMQELAPAEYAKMRDGLKLDGDWLDAAIKSVEANYARHGRSISSEAALDEVVADYVGTLLEDEGELERFIRRHQDDRTVLQKLRDIIREIIEKLKGNEQVKQLRKAEQELSKVLDAAVEQVKANTGAQKNTAQESDGKLSLKLGGYADVRVDVQAEMDYFGVTSLNDYIGVQKTVYKKLQDDGFFDKTTNRKTVENADTGIVVEIGKDGINETFGPDKRYAYLPAELKRLKIATVRHLPEIIRYGEVIDDGASNYHNENSDLTYTYIQHPITVGDKTMYVRVDIRQSRQTNKFWVHGVYVGAKKGQALDANADNSGSAINKDLTSEGRVTQPDEIVKAENAGVEIDTKTESASPGRFSLKDQDYMTAVENGDMETAQRMVDEAAKQWGAFLNNADANEVFSQGGEVRTFYHGTNTGEFTVFNKALLGNSSGDLGWFGKGFYFAFSKQEAETYGGRVVNAYLKIKNPYDYSQLYKYKGSDQGASRYSRFAWLYNMVKQFPDIVKGQKVYAYPNGTEEGKAVSWEQVVSWMDSIERKAKFSVERVEMSNGETAWELRANPKQNSFTNDDGETFTWTEYGMRQLFATEAAAKEPINQIGAYLVNVMGVEPVPRRAIEEIDFSGAVQRAGYDGILQSPSGDEAVVFDPSQIKSAEPVTYDDNGNVIPLSERFNAESNDIRFSLKDSENLVREIARIQKEGAKNNRSEAEINVDINAAVKKVYTQFAKDYGTIEPGERPAREVAVPEWIDPKAKEKVSQTVRTIMEAGATPDSLLPELERMVATREFSYTVYSDKAAKADADAFIISNGWNNAYAEWSQDVKKGVVSKKNTAIGWTMFNNAVTEGDTASALDILTLMVGHQRNAAQAVQATRILKQLGPSAELYGVQRSVGSMQEELNERYGTDKVKLEIDKELAEKLMNEKDTEKRDEILKDIYRDIGRQMPSTFRDKWNAWRYLAMLGNPRTHVRNILGNAFFMPVVAAKDLTATAIEAAVFKVSGGQLTRSKRMPGKALLSAAWGDYAKVSDQMDGTGKYSDFANANKYIEEGRQVFKSKLGGMTLEKARRGNSALLEREDAWFSQPHYAFALAQYCKANGITEEQIRSGKGKAMDEARGYAIREARKATYRDTNALSQFLSKRMSERGEYASLGKKVNVFIEGVLPFRRTPANILVRGLEYSPLGLLGGIKKAVWDVRKGKSTGAEAIDSISAGLTGTGLLALGAYLAAQGLIRGSGGGDKKEREFEELMGHQVYSLELPGGKSITLDWLAPEALPFFVGVNMWEQTQGKVEEISLDTMLSAVGSITEPLLEMSCLQSLNDLFDAVGYASNEGLSGLPSAIASAVTSYITQALPTIGGQIERTGENLRYTTYTEAGKFLTKDMQYTLGKATNRIPGIDYQQIPYIDAWGRTESSSSGIERAFNNFLNPAYTSDIDTSAMEEELLRLYEQTGEAGVFPSRAARYFTVDGERKDLTAEEYVAYATEKGQRAYELVADLVISKAYKAMSDTEKVKAVREAYDLANQIAKASISDYETDSWISKAMTAERLYKIPVETYIGLRSQTAGVESLKDKNGDTIENSASLLKMQIIYNTPGLTDKQRQALFEYFGVGKKVRHYNKALVDQKIKEMRK